MRHALINADGIIENTIEIADGTTILAPDAAFFVRPTDTTLVDDPDGHAVVGGTYDGANFVPPEPPPPPPVVPDVRAFEQAALAKVGPVRGNEIYAKYPLFLRALDKGDWPDARGLLGVALQTGDITQQEHDTLAAAMTEANIP